MPTLYCNMVTAQVNTSDFACTTVTPCFLPGHEMWYPPSPMKPQHGCHRELRSCKTSQQINLTGFPLIPTEDREQWMLPEMRVSLLTATCLLSGLTIHVQGMHTHLLTTLCFFTCFLLGVWIHKSTKPSCYLHSLLLRQGHDVTTCSHGDCSHISCSFLLHIILQNI